MPEILTNPGTLVAFGTLLILGGPVAVLYFATRDPCPGCGKRRHTTDIKKVLGVANLKEGGQWVATDIRIVKCRTKGCTHPEEEKPLPPRPARDDEVAEYLLS